MKLNSESRKLGKIIIFVDDEDITPGVLNLLQLLNVPATFFVVGWRLRLPAAIAIETMRRTYGEVNFS